MAHKMELSKQRENIVINNISKYQEIDCNIVIDKIIKILECEFNVKPCCVLLSEIRAALPVKAVAALTGNTAVAFIISHPLSK